MDPKSIPKVINISTFFLGLNGENPEILRLPKTISAQNHSSNTLYDKQQENVRINYCIVPLLWSYIDPKINVQT